MISQHKAPDAPTRTLTRGNNQVSQNGFWRSPPASVWNESAEIRDFFYQTPNAGFYSLRTNNKKLKHIREAFIAFSRLVYDCYLFSKGYYQTQTKRYQTLIRYWVFILGSAVERLVPAPSWRSPKPRPALGNVLRSWKKFYRSTPAGGVRFLDSYQLKIQEHLSINNLLYFVNTLKNKYNLAFLKFQLNPG